MLRPNSRPHVVRPRAGYHKTSKLSPQWCDILKFQHNSLYSQHYLHLDRWWLLQQLWPHKKSKPSTMDVSTRNNQVHDKHRPHRSGFPLSECKPSADSAFLQETLPNSPKHGPRVKSIAETTNWLVMPMLAQPLPISSSTQGHFCPILQQISLWQPDGSQVTCIVAALDCWSHLTKRYLFGTYDDLWGCVDSSPASKAGLCDPVGWMCQIWSTRISAKNAKRLIKSLHLENTMPTSAADCEGEPRTSAHTCDSWPWIQMRCLGSLWWINLSVCIPEAADGACEHTTVPPWIWCGFRRTS